MTEQQKKPAPTADEIASNAQAYSYAILMEYSDAHRRAEFETHRAQKLAEAAENFAALSTAFNNLKRENAQLKAQLVKTLLKGKRIPVTFLVNGSGRMLMTQRPTALDMCLKVIGDIAETNDSFFAYTIDGLTPLDPKNPGPLYNSLKGDHFFSRANLNPSLLALAEKLSKGKQYLVLMADELESHDQEQARKTLQALLTKNKNLTVDICILGNANRKAYAKQFIDGLPRTAIFGTYEQEMLTMQVLTAVAERNGHDLSAIFGNKAATSAPKDTALQQTPAVKPKL